MNKINCWKGLFQIQTALFTYIICLRFLQKLKNYDSFTILITVAYFASYFQLCKAICDLVLHLLYEDSNISMKITVPFHSNG